MTSFPRRSIAFILLAAILMQVSSPIYPTYAAISPLLVTDELVETNTIVLVTLTSTQVGISSEIAAATAASAAATAASATLQGGETFWQRVLNVAAYAAINIILQTITRQIVGWVQGTDSGFIQNLQNEALRTADAETGGLLVDLTGVNLCGNIGAFLRLSLGAPSVSLRQRLQCSVSGIVGNFENFYDNFANGGWPAFFQVALEPQNNAYGAFLLTLNEQFERQSERQEALTQKLLSGSGFKGFEVPREARCENASADKAVEIRRFLEIQQRNGKPTKAIKEFGGPTGLEVPTFQVCDVEYDTKTPGKLFADALPTAAFSGLRRTELATQIDQGVAQIITALLQRIIRESVSGGRGVFGASDIGIPPRTTLAEAGFRPTYLTNQTDDDSLRLGASQPLLDAQIQDLDRRIGAIEAQIAALQKLCEAPNPGGTCDQAQIDKLNEDKTPLTQERSARVNLLVRARDDLARILNLRAQFLTATDPALLENLNTRFIGIRSDAEQIIQQAGGPPVGQLSTDADDNFVRIIASVQDRAGRVGAYLDGAVAALDTEIAAQNDQVKKAALSSARAARARTRDDLRTLSGDLDTLRTNYLAAASEQTSVSLILNQITAKIGAINDTILSVYAP